MWDWFNANAVWILVIASVLVLLLLLFNDRIRKYFSRGKPSAGANAFFWLVEGLAFAVMVLAFISMTASGGDGESLITTDSLRQWFLNQGIRIIIMILVGVVLWIVLRRTIPTLVTRITARPQSGESPEGLKKRADTLQGVFLGLGRIIIILLVVFMVLSELNVPIGPILAGFGIAGVAVGFGAQYLIRDLIAGVFILMENQYRVGDVAAVGGVTGLVEEVNLRKTVLRDLDGVVHHVPNGEIRIASNYSRHFSRVNLNVTVAYNTDLDRAINVINSVCQEMACDESWKSVFRTVPRVLRVDKLGDSGIDIKVVGEVKPMEQWNVMGELRLRLKRTFDKEGIEMPYPHVKVYFGNKPGAM